MTSMDASQMRLACRSVVTKLESLDTHKITIFLEQYQQRHNEVYAARAADAVRNAVLQITKHSEYVSETLWYTIAHALRIKQLEFRAGTAQQQAMPLAQAADVNHANMTTEQVLDLLKERVKDNAKVDSTEDIDAYLKEFTRIVKNLDFNLPISDLLPSIFGAQQQAMNAKLSLPEERKSAQQVHDVLHQIPRDFLRIVIQYSYRKYGADAASFKPILEDPDKIYQLMMKAYDEIIGEQVKTGCFIEKDLLEKSCELNHDINIWMNKDAKVLHLAYHQNKNQKKRKAEEEVDEEPSNKRAKGYDGRPLRKDDLRHELNKRKSAASKSSSPRNPSKSAGKTDDEKRANHLETISKLDAPSKEDLEAYNYKDKDGKLRCPNCKSTHQHTSRTCKQRCRWCVEKNGEEDCKKNGWGWHNCFNCKYGPMDFGSWKIDKNPSECAKMDPLLKDLCKPRPAKGDRSKSAKKPMKKFNLLGTVLSEDEPIYKATATAERKDTACRVVFDTGATDIAVSHDGGHAIARALGLTPTSQEVYITLGNGSVVRAPERIEIPTLTVNYPGLGGDNCIHFRNATVDILSPAFGVSNEGEEAIIYIGQTVLKEMGFNMNDVLINAAKKTGGVVQLGRFEKTSIDTHLNAVQRTARLSEKEKQDIKHVFGTTLAWSKEDMKELEEELTLDYPTDDMKELEGEFDELDLEEQLEGRGYYEEFPNKIGEPPEEK
jgi:hypothetical protein